jgi:uncharacterized protein
MKRNKRPAKQIEVLSTLVNRARLQAKLGQSYGTDRDLYQALGYPTELDFDDYWAQYVRQDIAKAIIDRPVKKTWQGDVLALEANDKETSQFERAWEELMKNLQLKTRFIQLDKLTGIGHYAVLLLGFDDVKESMDWTNPVGTGARKLLYVKALSESNAVISEYETKTDNPRYGLPVLYDLTTTTPDGESSSTLRVHYSRVIHVVEDAIDSEVEGTPRLESVFNRLLDLEKMVGGSAEMFWRGARPGYQGKVDPEFTMTDAVKEGLIDQLDEYEHNLRRILMLEGVNMQALESQVADPANHVDIQIQMISSVTGIPKRILTGSERGELSSGEDKNQWAAFISARREEFAEPKILIPFIDICIKYKILPKVEDYYIQWEDLFSLGDKDKAEIGKTRAEALRAYAAEPLAQYIMGPDAFFEFLLGLDGNQIELVKTMMGDQIKLEEEDTFEDDEAIIEEETIEKE